MRNTLQGSAIQVNLVGGFRWPDVPVIVQDGFGPDALVTLQGDRWSGFVGSQFAILVGDEVRKTAVTSTATLSQTLERDERGRALVLGGGGESVYAVDATGAASCLGVLPDKLRASNGCWLRDGFALVIGDDVCVYRGGDPVARFASGVRRPLLRGLPHDGNADVIVAIYDDAARIFAVAASGEVRAIATFEDVMMGDVRLFLDETGNRTMLPDGPCVNEDAHPVRFDGIDETLAALADAPPIPSGAAPPLGVGPDVPAPGGTATPARVPAAHAGTPPSIDGLHPLTRALIKMLRAAPERPTPLADVLALIDRHMARDLRALLHAWAHHHPIKDAVYDFWMSPPRAVTEPYIREQAGEALHIGIYASGEPIVARTTNGKSEVFAFDEEGHAQRFDDLEAFLEEQEFRAMEAEYELELTAWLGD